MKKTFRGDIEFFYNKLVNKENFAITRYGDGEMIIMTNRYINLLNKDDLLDLNSMLSIEDEVLFNWYLNVSKKKIKAIKEITTTNEFLNIFELFLLGFALLFFEIFISVFSF